MLRLSISVKTEREFKGAVKKLKKFQFFHMGRLPLETEINIPPDVTDDERKKIWSRKRKINKRCRRKGKGSPIWTKCSVCGDVMQRAFYCGECKSKKAAYCSDECWAKDWPNHKNDCTPKQ